MNHDIIHGRRVGFFALLDCVPTSQPIFLVLDPRLSYNGLREDYAEDADLLAGLDKSKAALEAHFKAHYSRYRKVRVSIGRMIFEFWLCITFSSAFFA
jgi:hypothetical protein